MLVRLVEMVTNLQRTELIDQPVLEGLLNLGRYQTSQKQHEAAIGYLLEDFSRPERIRILTPPAWKILPELNFAIGRYAEGSVPNTSSGRFLPTNVSKCSWISLAVFLNTHLESDKLLLALTAFEGSQIQPEADDHFARP